MLLEQDYPIFGMVRRALQSVRPREVYNLAAQSFVPTSLEQLVPTADLNGLGVTRLSGASCSVDRQIRFLPGSERFGQAPAVPQSQSMPVYPRRAYGASKPDRHFVTVNDRESYGLSACSGILFHHESLRRGRKFATAGSAAVAVMALEAGRCEPCAGNARREAVQPQAQLSW